MTWPAVGSAELAAWVVLRTRIEDGVLLVVAAREAGVPLRTAQRWLPATGPGGLRG